MGPLPCWSVWWLGTVATLRWWLAEDRSGKAACSPWSPPRATWRTWWSVWADCRVYVAAVQCATGGLTIGGNGRSYPTLNQYHDFVDSEGKWLSYRIRLQSKAVLGVGDPWHFGADTDSGPLTNRSGSGVLSSLTLRTQKFFFFIFFSLNLPIGTLSPIFNLLL